ncbi:DNA glycosylase [Panus rudis PR-1116 ss-1]|nr:DNA glycosylase [Panus rudis PR-1116 ss-1]
MAGKRRAISPVGLVAKPSPFNPSVTLFTAGGSDTSVSNELRRSKRIKTERTDVAVKEEEGASTQLPFVATTKRTNKGHIVPSTSLSTLEVKVEELDSNVATATRAATPRKKAKVKREPSTSPRKPKPIQKSLDIPHPAPPHWKEVYDIIKGMRSKIAAPVDTMGCDQAQLKETDPRTKDEVTDAAVSKLRDVLGGSLTVEAVLAADESVIAEAIAKVGFWRRKTQYIKQTARKLKNEFDSDVPKTVDELCSLPGVGPKMAFLALQVAWNINVGIGVDVHVHRITNRLGWHKPPTKTPEETRLNLQSWLPTELHPEINHLLVGFGQTICTPVAPRCDACELSTTGLCPSARKVTKTKKTQKKGTVASAGPRLEISLENTEETKAVLGSPPSPLSDVD